METAKTQLKKFIKESVKEALNEQDAESDTRKHENVKPRVIYYKKAPHNAYEINYAMREDGQWFERNWFFMLGKWSSWSKINEPENIGHPTNDKARLPKA